MPEKKKIPDMFKKLNILWLARPRKKMYMMCRKEGLTNLSNMCTKIVVLKYSGRKALKEAYDFGLQNVFDDRLRLQSSTILSCFDCLCYPIAPRTIMFGFCPVSQWITHSGMRRSPFQRLTQINPCLYQIHCKKICEVTKVFLRNWDS